MNRSRYLTALRRHALVVVMSVIVSTGVVLFLAKRGPTTYQATSLVRIGAVPSGASFGIDVQYSDRLLNTYRRLVITDRLVEEMQARVERETGTRMPGVPGVAASAPANTELLAITVTSPARDLVAPGANALAGVLVDDIRATGRNQDANPGANADGALVPTASVVQPADDAARAGPPLALVLPGAAVLGVAVALAAVAVLARADRRLTDVDEIEAVAGLDVVALLRPEPRRRRSAEVGTGASRLTRVGLDVLQRSPRRVLFVGRCSYDVVGVAVGVATAMARMGRDVLIVEANPFEPALDRYFESPGDTGLTTLLDGTSTVANTVVKSEVPSISFLNAGPAAHVSPRSFPDTRLAVVLDEAERNVDLTVLSGPDLLAGPSASVLAEVVDLVVLVVRLGDVVRRDLLEVVDHLGALSAPCGGVVVLDRAFRFDGDDTLIHATAAPRPGPDDDDAPPADEEGDDG